MLFSSKTHSVLFIQCVYLNVFFFVLSNASDSVPCFRSLFISPNVPILREREKERETFFAATSFLFPIPLTTFDGIILHELILFILMVIAVIQFCANIWKIRLFVL